MPLLRTIRSRYIKSNGTYRNKKRYSGKTLQIINDFFRLPKHIITTIIIMMMYILVCRIWQCGYMFETSTSHQRLLHRHTYIKTTRNNPLQWIRTQQIVLGPIWLALSYANAVILLHVLDFRGWTLAEADKFSWIRTFLSFYHAFGLHLRSLFRYFYIYFCLLHRSLSLLCSLSHSLSLSLSDFYTLWKFEKWCNIILLMEKEFLMSSERRMPNTHSHL